MADPLIDRIKNVFVPKDSAPPPSAPAPATEEDEFDEQGFREAAKSLGTYSDQEIEDFIKREKAGLKSPQAEPKAEDVKIDEPFKEFEGLAKAGVGYLGYKLGRALIPKPPDDNTPPNNPPNNPSNGLDEIKRQNLINAEKRAQELHDLEIQLKKKKLEGGSIQPKSITERTIGAQLAVEATNELPPEVTNSEPYKQFTALEEKSGGPITTATDLKMIQQSEANRIANEEAAKAKAAGVTPSTPAPEAETLVTSHEDALTPAEKIEEKVVEAQASTKSRRPELVGPVKHVEIPEGRIPNYMEYKMKNGERVYVNKKGSDVIGKGAYNWLQGQWGPEKTQQIFEDVFGKKNVTYDEMQKAIAEGKLPVPPKDEQGRGGSFPREPHVPEYIRGNVNPALLSHMLYGGLAGLTALHEGQNAKQAYERGDTGMAASHLSQIANLTLPGLVANQLFGISPEELQTLRSAKQGRKVGGGRGVAPPSAYGQ